MGTMNARKSEQYAWAGFILLFVAATVAVMMNSLRSTLPPYRFAALNWIHGVNLYDLSGIGGFTYFPQAAILIVPFALLPPMVGEVAWRLVNVAAFAFSLWEVSRLLRERTGKPFFPVMTLLALPLAWDCARNGQATLLMIAFMLLGMADMARSRRWRAALWLCLAVSIKPLAIVLVLLIMAIDLQMSWRLALALLITALSPFLTQDAGYVMQQYRACIQNMTTAAHVGVVAHGWTTPFTGLRVWGIMVPEKVQTVIRLAAALGTLGLAFRVHRRYDAVRGAILLYSLSALYLILFSPRTENNTYAMLGPAIGYCAAVFVQEKRMSGAGLLGGLVAVMVGSRVIERLVSPGREQVWMSPLLAAILGVYVVVQILSPSGQCKAKA